MKTIAVVVGMGILYTEDTPKYIYTLQDGTKVVSIVVDCDSLIVGDSIPFPLDSIL